MCCTQNCILGVSSRQKKPLNETEKKRHKLFGHVRARCYANATWQARVHLWPKARSTRYQRPATATCSGDVQRERPRVLVRAATGQPALGINGYRQCYEHTYVLLLSTGSLFSVDSWGFNLYTSPMLGRVIDMTIMSHDVIMLHLVAILQTRPI